MNPESIVAQIQGLSTSPQDIDHLHTLLKKSDDFIRSESTRFAPFLSQLDPAIHSLGYLYLLYVPFFTQFFQAYFTSFMVCFDYV